MAHLQQLERSLDQTLDRIGVKKRALLLRRIEYQRLFGGGPCYDIDRQRFEYVSMMRQVAHSFSDSVCVHD